MTETTTPRKRNAAVTREMIVTAARSVFTQRGYDGCGIRDIAAEAGVNVALINRYFGSKLGLFAQAVLCDEEFDALLAMPLDQMADVLSDLLTTKPLTKPDFDITLAILRSVSNSAATEAASQKCHDRFTTVLAAQLTGDDRLHRAEMVLAVVAGVDLMRRVYRAPALAEDGIAAQPYLRDMLWSLIYPDEASLTANVIKR